MTSTSRSTSRDHDKAGTDDERQARELVAQVILTWRGTSTSAPPSAPSARQFLDDHPDIERHQSLVLDLAVEEYCLRRDRGDPLEPIPFAAQFPTVGESLAGLLLFFQQSGPQIKHILNGQGIQWPRTNEVLNGFLLLQELYRGDHSRVFLAAELSLGERLVVLKILATVTAEAHVLGSLAHPNVVPLLSVQSTTFAHSKTGLGTPCTIVVMPFAGCTTLADLIRNSWTNGGSRQSAKAILQIAKEGSLGQHIEEVTRTDDELTDDLPFDVAIVRITIQVCRALHFAHCKGILHRDLKPSNILLSPNCRPMLMDFGTSVNVSDPSVNITGTLPYMAPECLDFLARQRIGNSGSISRNETPAATPLTYPPHDQRSDIFSLGVILYQLLTGHLPFGASSQRVPVAEQASTILSRQHRSPLRRNDRNRHVPEELFHIIDQCLAPTIDQRPETFERVSDSLQRFVAGHGFQPTLQNTRRRTILAGMFATVGCAATIGASVFQFYGRDTDPLDLGIQAYENGDYQVAARHFLRGAKASDMRAIAANANSDSRTKVHVASCLFGLGQSYRKLEMLSDADNAFEEAVKFLTHPSILASLAYLRGNGPKAADSLPINEYSLQEWQRHISDSDSPRNRRMRACIQNNLAYHLARGRMYLRAEVLFNDSASRFANSDHAREVVCCNCLDLWMRWHSEGHLDSVTLLAKAREMPLVGSDSPYAGLVSYTTARAIAQADKWGRDGINPELTKLLLSAVAGGCPKDVLLANRSFLGTLSGIMIPDEMFEAAKHKPFSLSSLLLCPTESCRL